MSLLQPPTIIITTTTTTMWPHKILVEVEEEVVEVVEAHSLVGQIMVVTIVVPTTTIRVHSPLPHNHVVMLFR